MRPQVRLHTLRASGCSRLCTEVAKCASLLSSVLWDWLVSTMGTAVLVLLRLGAGGTTTGRGLAVARLVAVCWSPHDDDTIDLRFYLDNFGGDTNACVPLLYV